MKTTVKRLFSILLASMMVLSAGALCFAEQNGSQSGEITVVFTNDVHCNYLEYDKVATIAKDADLLVDAGDAIMGDLIGTLSEGEYIIEIMNYLGYDCAIPGNHEFSYGLDRFFELADTNAEFPYVCCNFMDLKTGKPVFDPYRIFDVKGKKIAIIGIATPETLSQTLPSYFQDENETFIYGFCEENNGADMILAVQGAADAARAAGADCVIATGHLGIYPQSSPWAVFDIVGGTNGIDAFIDGHSHTVYTSTYKNKDGKDIPTVQTGTELANCGRLTISPDGEISIELVPLADIERDAQTTAFIDSVTDRFVDLQEKVVAKTEVDLTIMNEDGTRAVRNKETNMANFCTDAYKMILGADVAIINGGGVRAGIGKGEITFGDIIAVHPFGNKICLVEVSGQQILDALELGYSKLPEENGGFIQTSGISCTVNIAIPSSVVVNEKGEFVKVSSQRRVSDVKINGEPIDPAGKYKLASHNYMLLESGDGFSMFGRNNVKTLQDSVLIDNQVLIDYIVNYLDGYVGEEYAKARTNLNIIYDETLVSGADDAPGEEQTPQNEYTVVKGDCLWRIAEKVYGDAYKWRLIYDANRDVIKNADLIYVGQVFEIPAA